MYKLLLQTLNVPLQIDKSTRKDIYTPGWDPLIYINWCNKYKLQ